MSTMFYWYLLWYSKHNHEIKWHFLIFHFLFYCRNTIKRIFIHWNYHEELFWFYYKWCKKISDFKPRLAFWKWSYIFRAVLFCKVYANMNNIPQPSPAQKNPKHNKTPPPQYIKASKPGYSSLYYILKLRMCMQHFQSQRGYKAMEHYLWKEEEKDSCTTEVVAGAVIGLAVFWAAAAGWGAEACSAGAAELGATGTCSIGVLVKSSIK